MVRDRKHQHSGADRQKQFTSNRLEHVSGGTVYKMPFPDKNQRVVYLSKHLLWNHGKGLVKEQTLEESCSWKNVARLMDSPSSALVHCLQKINAKLIKSYKVK